MKTAKSLMTPPKPDQACSPMIVRVRTQNKAKIMANTAKGVHDIEALIGSISLYHLSDKSCYLVFMVPAKQVLRLCKGMPFKMNIIT